jgi:peptide/nickel transport system permease protein
MGAERLLRFLAQRLVKAAIVVLAIVVFQFVLIRLAPSDPASVIAGQSGAADAEFMAQFRSQFGLDRPPQEQLWIYVKGILTLELGFSHRQQQTVASLIGERLPAALLLTGAAFLFAISDGVALGVAAARRVSRPADSVIIVIALTFDATPIFLGGAPAGADLLGLA